MAKGKSGGFNLSDAGLTKAPSPGETSHQNLGVPPHPETNSMNDGESAVRTKVARNPSSGRSA